MRTWMTPERVLLTGLSAFAFLLIVLTHPGQLYIDTRPDLYLDPGSLVRESLSTWVPGTGLGTTNYDNGYLPAALTLWGLNGIGLPAWVAMRVWRFALFLAAAWGARALLVDLTAADRPARAPGRVAVSVLYAASPYVVVGAATTPVMLPYALFPWLLLALRRTFVDGRVWRGLAAFGLLMFAMGGINAGVVPAFLLLAVPFVAWDAVAREGRRARAVLRGALASAGVTLLVSAYWIVGALIALSTASSVAAATEDPRTIAQVSSFAETMRGLGSWLIYGGDALGLYRPEFHSYLDSPLVVIATFTLPVLAFAGAWLSRSRLRRLATALTVLGLTLMVGAYPPGSPSPFGRALLLGFDDVPGFIAFRTTNKAGALAMLGMSLLGALAADAVWRRAPRARGWLSVGAGLGVLAAVVPMWLGMLFPGVLTVPSYWTLAASDADAHGQSRIWALPGETNAVYRWRPRGVDDFAPVLIRRPVVYGRSFPDGPVGAWNLLSSADEALGSTASNPELLSTYARYLGASDVLVRNDLVWELMGAPRPSQVVAAADGDPGLRPATLYGNSGENVAPTRQATTDVDELRLSPLIRYRVSGAPDRVRTVPAAEQLLIAGDNAALPGAVWAGLLDGARGFRLLPHTDETEVRRALESGGRLLLTDTNRRRVANVHRLDRSGPLLGADVDAEGILVLGSAEDQTVAAYDGIAGVTATASGSIFGPTPFGRPFLAVDGQLKTAWQFGDYGTAVGRSLTVRLEEPATFGSLVVRRAATDGAEVRSIRVETGGQSVSARFTDSDKVEVALPEEVTTDQVSLTITAVTNRGANQVGIAELRIPHVHASEYAELPRTLDRLADSEEAGSLVTTTPVDVLLTRSAREGEEQLRRRLSLPSGSSYRLRAELRTTEPRLWRRCRQVARIDGEPVLARAQRVEEGGPGGRASVDLRGCAPVDLGAGEHRLVTRSGSEVQRVLLKDTRPSGGAGAPASAELTWSATATSVRAEVAASDQDQYLVVNQALDRRWSATVDGRPAGPPVEINGYAMGWRLPAGAEHTVVVRFGPQRAYVVALIVSLLATAACALLLIGRLVRSRVGGRR